MVAVQLAERDLVDISSETDETRRIRVDFPISSVAGAASTAVVYFELEPGEHTGMHTDSAEEIVLVLSGQGGGDRRRRARRALRRRAGARPGARPT